MLMVENQLPLLVLNILRAVEMGEEMDEVREDLLGSRRLAPRAQTRISIIHSSVTKLHEAGVKFVKLNDIGINDITFRNRTLYLPYLKVDDIMETMFLNFIAYERLDSVAGYQVISYIFLMGSLIRSAKDAKLLASHYIIPESHESQIQVVKFFRQFGNGIRIDEASNLAKVMKLLQDYYIKNKDNWLTWSKRSVREWNTTLVRIYFKSPWTLISLLAAALMLALMMAQTYYANKSQSKAK
ncbi:putative UPF0481 protein At3g02645 isoform X2 [Tasmannia lanceolata]|uniref:putative UPF0481 protein At3g02645 isoform X2 n=1 Tax=Tasmannia lanceolata TaxID=3420 RepID=UPI004062DAF1